MMGKENLTPVIKVDDEKCVNCHACIAACPVKYCMDASGDVISINHDLCIGCGKCISACTHQARLPADDTERFFDALKKREKMIAIVAPAVASNFPGRYLNLNGYLKSLGIEAIFDVSFGAELTVLSYVHHLTEDKPELCISQPCPVIVTFLEIYHPELLPYLAPADSPMGHTVKMIKEYYPQYKQHRVAVFSPCIAKRREFDETGLGDYNVTFIGVFNYLERNKINLGSHPAQEYDNPLAERAVTFSMPGGLLITAERESPGIGRITRKIEGIHTIYPYLADVAAILSKGVGKSSLPRLIDCLNCEKGCNGGTGTRNAEAPLDQLEAPIWKRRAEVEAKYGAKNIKKARKNIHKVLSRYWKSGLYRRVYRNLSGNYQLKKPTDEQLKKLYQDMKKFSERDYYDCNTCGYGSCHGMALAIFNGINKPENCHHYNLSIIEESKASIDKLNKDVNQQIAQSISFVQEISVLIGSLNEPLLRQSAALEESSSSVEEMMATIRSASTSAQKKQEAMHTLVDNVGRGRESMRKTIEAVSGISQSVEGVASTIKVISGIAANTNLLSMNAAIESAHAGEAGKGFAVVADEIRRLSETTRQNSQDISHTLSNIVDGIKTTSGRSTETDGLISQMDSEINSFANTMEELIRSLEELSAGSQEITTALSILNQLSLEVKSSYTDMIDKTRELESVMRKISGISDSPSPP
jgi:iron only hydrogenase large subunit-like protein/uncharacterized protein YoxC